jgi:uncharacterized protein YraI
MPAAVVATATRHLGAPYATIGASPATGFSCIGFVHFVFAQHGITVPYDIPRAWQSAPHVALGDLLPGDVLFFSNTVFAGLSHVAIYIGHDQMIGADNFAVGVTTDRLSDRYWMAHYAGATRPIAMMGSAPASDAAPPVAAAPAASAPAGTRLQPRATTIGVYSGPGYHYTPLGLLTRHTRLTVVQAQQGWYAVRFHTVPGGDLFGWVAAMDVGAIEESTAVHEHFSTAAADTQPPVQAAPAAELVRVTASLLNVRARPSEKAPVISVLFAGEVIPVLARSHGWDLVRLHSGTTGWASATWLVKKS